MHAVRGQIGVRGQSLNEAWPLAAEVPVSSCGRVRPLSWDCCARSN